MKSMFLALIMVAPTAWAQTTPTVDPSLAAEVNSVYPQVQQLYINLHENPELSLHETKTASKLATQVRELGYDVTEKVGGTGVVAVLRNGQDQQSCCVLSWMHFPSRRRPVCPTLVRFALRMMRVMKCR